MYAILEFIANASYLIFRIFTHLEPDITLGHTLLRQAYTYAARTETYLPTLMVPY